MTRRLGNNTLSFAVAVGGILAVASAFIAPTSAIGQSRTPTIGFTAAQAASGAVAYAQRCAACHGAALQGAGVAVPLKGSAFEAKWAGRPAVDLLRQIERMPPGSAASKDRAGQVDLLAFLLQANGASSGDRALPQGDGELAALILPGAASTTVSPVPVVIAPKPGPSRLDAVQSVTPATLRQPPAADWLNWRRTYDALGNSPLNQINRGNVARLKLAWAWSLPRGGNMMAPIIRNGVLYAYSYGDIVEALDAASGELLWRYQRKLTPGSSFQGKKGVAIAGDLILVPTSDMRLIALNARTGAVVWDHAIDVGTETHHQIKSAPLVTATKVIIGVNGFAEVKGGNFIVALDLATGKEAWRFHTLARPGEPGGDSWNDLPLAKRNGGSVWVSGSYDPDLNLVYFGVAPTYYGDGLRRPIDKPGVTNNGLYMDSTLALDADTGRLAWHFQHQPNDQIDHDWAFERSLLTLSVDGKPRKIVATAGKSAVFDALDAATGQYLFSMDLGLQNVITAIDPVTGAKTINPAAVPAAGQALKRLGMPGVCPDLLGARNLMSTAYSPRTRWLYVPLTDTCLDEFPDGARWQKHPDPASAGQFGMVQAIDLQSRRTMWTIREAAPPVGGAMTAGGLVYLGFADRSFRAYDERSGKPLWTTKLDSAPASYPATYSVDGKQYIAVATNEGFVHVQAMRQLAHIVAPPAGGATLWVFALP